MVKQMRSLFHSHVRLPTKKAGAEIAPAEWDGGGKYSFDARMKFCQKKSGLAFDVAGTLTEMTSDGTFEIVLNRFEELKERCRCPDFQVQVLRDPVVGR